MNKDFRYDCALNISGCYVVLLWDPDHLILHLGMFELFQKMRRFSVREQIGMHG